MVGKTLVYDEIPSDSYLTIEELNDLFNKLAVIINNKVDDGRPENVIDSFFQNVSSKNGQVVLGDGTTHVKSSFGLNYQPAINMAEGTEPSDGITIGQIRTALAGLV